MRTEDEKVRLARCTSALAPTCSAWGNHSAGKKLMPFKNLPIKRKMMLVIMLTSITALVLTAASFIAYDLVTFRQSLVRNLNSISTIIAENSTSALLLNNQGLATRNLSELKVDPHVRIAALYR